MAAYTNMLGFGFGGGTGDLGNDNGLDLEAANELAKEMATNVKKAIQIEFDQEQYPIAWDLIAELRTAGADVGGIIIELLQKFKEDGNA
jgi:hypothetical protein